VIFKKSLIKEFRQQAGIVFSCLITIVLTMALIRTLGNAASGATDPSIVIPLILFSTFSSLGTIATLTAFLTVFWCVSRMNYDNEMVIWNVSGVSLKF
jgi:lipopolysaccharide export system permease protein